jgi:hypothetical protein
LWAAHVPGKTKVHVWRLVENGLAVGTKLSHRRIKDGIIYLACNRTESLVHCFLTCPHLAMACSLLAKHTSINWEPPPKRLACHAELKGWLLNWIGKSSADQTSWFFTMLYNLWQARNDASETQNLKDPKSIAQQTCFAVEEWNGIHANCKTSEDDL